MQSDILALYISPTYEPLTRKSPSETIANLNMLIEPGYQVHYGPLPHGVYMYIYVYIYIYILIFLHHNYLKIPQMGKVVIMFINVNTMITSVNYDILGLTK